MTTNTDNRWVRDGLLCGLVAYAAVIVFYSGFDFLASRGPMFTVNLLGAGLFKGVHDPTILQYPIALDKQVIFWYNGVHLAISLAIGLFVLWLVHQAERRPSRAGLMAGLILAGFAATIAVIGRLTEPVRILLPWWSIVLANVAASACSAWALWRLKPGLVRLMLGGIRH